MPISLEYPLYSFNGTEPFTLADACEGVQIFGGIGSGKTSGSGAELARAYLRAGFGGLVLCAKKDVLEEWKTYAKQTGREKQLLVFDSSGKFVFPFLQYEIERQGEGAGYTENLVRLFTTIYETIDRNAATGGNDPYWTRAMQQLLRNCIDLCVISRGTVSIPQIREIILSAPKSLEEIDLEEWRGKSLCWKLLLEGHAKKHDVWTQGDFDNMASFWLEEFPTLSDKTRTSVISTLTTMLDMFLRRPFRQLFSETPPDPRMIAYPELTHRGVIIVLYLPVKEFAEAGRAVQAAYKYIWQQAAERRSVIPGQTVPVFLWADEAQNFITNYDMHFQATARSSMACTVYITQNLPNYYAELGGENEKHCVDSLVGNLQTKIFHANSDPLTNDKAAEIIGKSWQYRQSTSQSAGREQFNLSKSMNQSFDYDVPPQLFTMLKKGGKANGGIVEAVVFQNGRIWSTQKSHLFTQFKQTLQ